MQAFPFLAIAFHFHCAKCRENVLMRIARYPVRERGSYHHALVIGAPFFVASSTRLRIFLFLRAIAPTYCYPRYNVHRMVGICYCGADVVGVDYNNGISR